jgi:5-methylcytosine-specific restriction endonuclease McrA
MQKARAQKLGLTEHFTANEWLDLADKTGKRCQSCGVGLYSVALTPDHIKPLSKGGSNTIDNIQVLCWNCNAKKGNR